MTLNRRPYSNWREGLTIQDVIDENRFTWPKLVVKLNRKVIWPEQYAETLIDEGDDLEVLHLLGGG